MTDYAFVGRSALTFDEENSPKMGGYHLTNVRPSIRREGWRLEAFVENLINDRSNTFSFGNPFSLRFQDQVTALRPLTVGISVGADL